jgi:hypothetical protein
MAGDCTADRDRSDSGFFTVGWLGKLVVWFVIMGVVAIDGVTLAMGHLRVDDGATAAATAAANAYGSKHDETAARAAAAAAAQTDGTTLTSLVFADGNVTARVHGTIKTVALRYVPGTKALLAPDAVVTLKIVS